MPYGDETLSDENTLAPAVSRFRTRARGIGRDMEAARLKALGWDILDIAQAIGVATPDDPQKSAARAMAAIKRAMAAAVRFSKDELRYLDLAGLEELERRLWQMLADKHVLVSNGRIIYGEGGASVDDTRLKIEIIGMIASVKRDKAKLMGYIAPQRIEISDDMLNQAIAELSEQVEQQKALEAALGEDED